MISEAPRFPNDPVLRLLPSELPGFFLSLPPEEQAWRGRYFLMCWGADLPEAYSWMHAMQQTDAASVKELVESIEDQDIADQVQMRIEHDQLLEEMATMAQRKGGQ
jgi:hypothetical protein